MSIQTITLSFQAESHTEKHGPECLSNSSAYIFSPEMCHSSKSNLLIVVCLICDIKDWVWAQRW